MKAVPLFFLGAILVFQWAGMLRPAEIVAAAWVLIRVLGFWFLFFYLMRVDRRRDSLACLGVATMLETSFLWPVALYVLAALGFYFLGAPGSVVAWVSINAFLEAFRSGLRGQALNAWERGLPE